MWALRVICFITAVVAIWAATPCCIDREFEADIGVVGSTYMNQNFNEVQGYSTMSFDSHGKMVVLSTHAVVNETMNYSKIILDFNSKREYAVIGNRCTVFELNIPMRNPCIPDNATFLREAIYGYGSNTLYANTWEYFDNTTQAKTTLSVTRDTCIPLVVTQYRQQGAFTPNQQEELVMIYSNFHVGVRNRNVFKVPNLCANKPVQKPTGSISPF